MTLKELLGEQAKDIYFTATQRQMVGERLSIEEAQSFIRQSSIETVKWVIALITDHILYCNLADENGEKNYELIRVLAELNKSIEDHA